MTLSIAQRVRDLAKRRGDEVVYTNIADGGTESAFTWSALNRRSDQVAVALAQRGLTCGDRLAIGLRNSPHLLFGVLAAWKLGAVPVPMRWDLPDWELTRLTQAVDAKLRLTESDIGWLDLTSDVSAVDLPDKISPHMFGICSGGSTGLPKVILTNRPGVLAAEPVAPLAELWLGHIPRPQRICVLGPMYHANGFGTLFPFLDGDCLFVLEKFDASRVVDVIERHRITMFQCTPTMLKRVADLPDIQNRDLSSLEFIVQGAAPMPPSLVRRWCDLIGSEKLIMSYGMSEGLGLVAINGAEWLQHEGSVGRPLRGTEIRILDETGKQLPVRSIGDVYLRSPSYPGATYLGRTPPMPTTDDGFHCVGDLGYVDEDGYLYLADRRVDLIITGGANVYPAEVEGALIDHPKVADVVVIGLKDSEWGRRVHAVIAPVDHSDPPSLDEIRSYAKSRLAAYKAPHTIDIVTEIPRNEATKVNRSALVEARGG